jgi:energy-coupling factor transporter ATP-binding protein EcfA2
LLLIGDNGSGKSTVVDAFEFALQGQIGRSASLGGSMVPAALSFFDSTDGSVSVEFSDGEVFARDISRDDEGEIQYQRGAYSRFGLSPLVLRRADILQFWDTPDEKKQLLFFRFFRGSDDNGAAPILPPEVREAEQMLLRKKNLRRETAMKLAARRGPAAVQALLIEPILEEWITEFVYNGIRSETRELLKKQGHPVKIPPIEHKLLWQLREIAQEVNVAKRELKEIRKAAKVGQPAPKLAATKRGLEEISDVVTEAFSRLSPAGSFVRKIEIELGKLTEVSLEIRVRLVNGTVTTPRKVFSEANLDLLALLIYFAIAETAALKGQAKMLILDDVIQSVDGRTRVATVEYLLERTKDWQLVFTVHDRLWAEQLRQLFRRAGSLLIEQEIRRWSFEGGPEIVNARRMLASGLETAIESGEIYQICSEAGLLLERVCNQLSYALPISITRRREDKYTLGDLWPGVLKLLKRTDLQQEAEDVDRWIHLRNLVGGHFNEWAVSLSREESVSFGRGVLSLSDRVWFSDCDSWVDAVRFANKITEWRCSCGKHRIVPRAS